LLFDDNLTAGVSVPRGTEGHPGSVTYSYDAPQTMRSATVFVPGAKVMFRGPTVDPVLEASDDGRHGASGRYCRPDVPTTVSFAPVTARWFRLVLNPLASAGQYGRAGRAWKSPTCSACWAAKKSPGRWASFAFRRGHGRQFETKAGFNLALTITR
jgi:hypothetical protein